MLTDDVAKSRLGRTLRGKYQLDRVLGIGGMATVYAATHRNRMQFAIKMLHPELSVSEDMRARFLREGYAANSVNHRGAVAVLDEDVDEDGSAFLVMELLDGIGVEELWNKRGASLPVSMVLAMGDQLLDVLASAHQSGVIHRDLKPANLFLTRDGTLKVLDFGIARLRDAAAGHVTLTGTTLGTPAFMPPEQALGKASELDAQSDLWAVGATLFVLISGQLVHAGDNTNQLLLAAATSSARSLGSVALGVPAPVVALIDRALAFDKKHRWPGATEMRQALQRAHMRAFGKPVSAVSLGLSPADAPATAPTALAGHGTPATPVPPATTAPGTPAPTMPTPTAAAAASAQPVVPAAASPHTPMPAIVEVNIASAQVAPGAGSFAWPAVTLLVIVFGLAALIYLQRQGSIEPARPSAAAAPAAPLVAPAEARPDSIRAATPPAAEPAAVGPAAAPPQVAPQIAPRPDRAPAAFAPPAPIPSPAPSAATPLSAACARLLERQSLGETLGPEESKQFAQRCRR